MISNSKFGTCLAPDLLNFNAWSQLRQQKLPFGSINLKNALESGCQSRSCMYHQSYLLTRSVMIVLTQFAPVRGRLQSDTTFGDPSLAVWLVATTILVWSGFEIKSMAPPMPLKTFPGIM